MTTRRDFILGLGALGGASFSAALLNACSAGTEPSPASGSEALACEPASISANHNHALSLPQADIEAGVTKTYSIQGTSGHPHSVTVTREQFAALRAGESIRLTSTTEAGHAHTVTIRCAGPAPEDAGLGDSQPTDRGDAGARDAQQVDSAQQPDSGAHDAEAADSSDVGQADAGVDASRPDADVSACQSIQTIIGENHRHALTIPLADVLAGQQRTYSIRGTSTHDHSVTIGAGDFARLRAGDTLSLSSVGGLHDHSITVTCA